MKGAAALGLLLVLGIWAGHALAAGPSPEILPTTTIKLATTTVSLPTTVKLTTTLPTTVKVTTTTVKVPTTTVKVPTTTVKVPSTPVSVATTTPKLPTTTTATKLPATSSTPTKLPSGGTTAGTPLSSGSSGLGLVRPSGGSASAAGSSGGGNSGSPAEAGNRGSARASGVRGVRSSRPYLVTKGPKKQRKIIISFVLSKGGRVHFVVTQVSPVCRVVGRFSVRGHAGRNRIPFAGRVHGRVLGPGTYTISVRRAGGRNLKRLRLVVFESGVPSRADVAAARASDVCRAMQGAATIGRTSTGASDLTSTEDEEGQVLAEGEEPSSATAIAMGPNTHSGEVLGASVADRAARAIRPVLVALLALSIVLLGLAALPRTAVPDRRLNDLLARHRQEIAALGAMALVAVALVFLLG
jgi:hypothetical protein